MSISRRPKTQGQAPNVDVDALIAKGGSVAHLEAIEAKSEEEGIGSFTLRVPKKLLRQIEQQLKTKPIKTDRQRWILESMVEKLERDQ